jgi:hypothetical protein
MRALFLLALFFASCADAGVSVATKTAALLPESDHPPHRDPRPAAVLADGSSVISRPGDEPGESELWYQPATPGEEARVLFPAPGADDRPTALPDGRVLFISTRSTIASLWIGDVKTGRLVQLTNQGLLVGKARTNFIPPPHGEITVHETGLIEYDAGGGQIQRLRIDEVER